MSTPRKPRLFLSRTTAGLAALAEKVAAVLTKRGFEIIHQPDFGLEWRRIRHMLMEKIREADAVLCLVGPAYGAAPRTTIPEFRHPDTGREEYSYTQLEYLIARRLHKPVVTLLVPDAFSAFARPEDRGTPEQQQLQSDFIRDFIKKDEHVFHEFSSEADLLGAIRSRLIPIPSPLLPPPFPENIPFRSIGTIFTGRTGTLRELRKSLVSAGNSGNGSSHHPAVQLIHGTGGVGKTRLTVEYAHTHNADYTARLFVRGGSPGALDESLASLAGLFILNLEEQDEMETDIRITAVIRWLAEHPTYLLVIDNVDTDEARDHAVQVLGKLPAGHVLITSRLHTWPGDILRTPLDVLSDTDSRDLLLKYRSSPKAPAPDTDAVDALSLAHDLDGLALALEQAAAYLNVLAITIAEYHERWKTNAARVREWHDPVQMGYPASVATTWLTSFEQLAAASQALMNLLSWLAPDPIPRFLLKPLAEKKLQPDPLGGTDPYKALGELVHFSVANPTQNGTAFAVHRLIQQVTRERQEPPSPAPALFTVLEWVNEEMPIETYDVRTWPIAIPLAPHAIAAANFAADREIPEPSARLLNDGANLLTVQANHRAAEPLIRRALAIDEAGFGKDHPNVAIRLNNLAELLKATNRLAEAEPLYRRALAILEVSLGKDHPNFACGLNNLAQLLRDTNRLDEAELLMRRALAIAEASFGKDHPNVAISLNNLAALLTATNRIAEADPLYRRALAILEVSLGNDHPNVARGLNNLSALMYKLNRLAEAEPLIRRALSIDETSYGRDHPNVATALNNLARLLQDTNRLAEAEPLYRRALAIDEASYGNDHPMVSRDLSNLAKLLQATNRPGEAEPFMRRALEVSEKALVPNHPDTLQTLASLADLLEASGQLEEAMRLHKRAIDAQEQTLGAGHPETLRSWNQYSYTLRKHGDASRAEPIDRKLAEATASVLGETNPRTIHRRNNLVLTLVMLGKLEEARALLSANWQLNAPPHANTTPRVAFLRHIIAVLGSESNTPFLGQLKTFRTGPELPVARDVAVPWDIAYFIGHLGPKLPSGSADFLTAFVDALNDRTKVSELEQFPEWTNQPPIPLDAPWPN